MPNTPPTRHEVVALQSTLNTHLTECMEENRKTRATLNVLSEGLEGLEDLLSSAKRLIWRAFVGIFGIIFTVGVTILAQNFQYKQAAKADVAQHTQLRYTAQDAARDKAVQADRDAELLAAIKRK